jgi:hypothetical protein
MKASSSEFSPLDCTVREMRPIRADTQISNCVETYYDGLLTDLHRPLIGSMQVASLYVQPSQVQSLDQLSIMRGSDPAELRTSVSNDLIDELEWETWTRKRR